MATLDFMVTDTPQDLGAALGIDFSTTHYMIENLSNSERVRFRFVPAAPAASERGPILEPGESRECVVSSTDKVWAWIPRRGASAPITLDAIP